MDCTGHGVAKSPERLSLSLLNHWTTRGDRRGFSPPSLQDLAHTASLAHSAPLTGLSCYSASEHSGSPSTLGTPREPSDPVHPFS